MRPGTSDWVISQTSMGEKTGSFHSVGWSVANPHGDQIAHATVHLSYTLSATFRGHAQMLGMPESVIRWALGRLEQVATSLRDVDAGPEPALIVIDVKRSDIPEILARSIKNCEWQVAQGRDLYCLAPDRSDPTADSEVGGRRAAPTSRPVCEACRVPDESLLCSHFSHVRLAGVTVAERGVIARDITEAMCNLGQPGVDRAPQDCRPGGHACWERVVVPTPVAITRAHLPVTEALDFLDASWRLRFGKEHRLVGRANLAAIAGLEAGCASRDEFVARLRDLKEVLDRLDVAGVLLGSSSSGAASPQGSIGRLQRCLEAHLKGEALDHATAAVSQLREINRLRNEIEHDPAKAGRRMTALGAPYPPPSWGEAWYHIRGVAADAFDSLRRSLEVDDEGGGLFDDFRS